MSAARAVSDRAYSARFDGIAICAGRDACAGLARRHYARIVQIALRDEHEMPAGVRLKRLYFARELRQKVERGRIGEGVHGVESEAVEVIIT